MTLEIDRIYCGDCLDLLPNIEPGTVDMVLADPPYSSGGMFRGDRMQKVRTKYQTNDTKKEYLDFEGDNRDQRAFYAWAMHWMRLCRQASKDGAIIGTFCDWRQLPTVTDALQGAGWIWLGIAVWDKTEAARPQTGRYRNQCEYLVWGTKGQHREQTAKCLPGVFRMPANCEEKYHMTGKPIALLEQLLEICKPGGLVLDPFIGSGSTAVACKRTGRHYIGIEIVPDYIPIIEQRIANVPAPLFSSEGQYGQSEGVL